MSVLPFERIAERRLKCKFVLPVIQKRIPNHFLLCQRLLKQAHFADRNPELGIRNRCCSKTNCGAQLGSSRKKTIPGNVKQVGNLGQICCFRTLLICSSLRLSSFVVVSSLVFQLGQISTHKWRQVSSLVNQPHKVKSARRLVPPQGVSKMSKIINWQVPGVFPQLASPRR